MKNDNFLLSLSISILLHLLIMYFFLFGMPYSASKYKPEEQIIIFEMANIDDVTNIPTQTKMRDKQDDIKPEEVKKILNTTPPVEEPEPEKPKEPEKKVEIKKAEDKIKDPKNAESIKAEEKKEEPKPKEPEKKEVEKKEPEKKVIEKPKEIEKKEVKKEPEKPKLPKKKTSEDELESLLKTLEKASKGNNSKSDKILKNQGDANSTSKGPSDGSEKLSITEIALIRNKINKAWNLPVGIYGGENVIVTLYIAFAQDGSISQVKIKNMQCTLDQNACKIMADSALRAVWKASPIEGLRKERYDLWKEINIDFDPRKIIGR